MEDVYKRQQLFFPVDVVVTKEFSNDAEYRVVKATEIADDEIDVYKRQILVKLSILRWKELMYI